MDNDSRPARQEEPLARLEQELMSAYAAEAGYELLELLGRSDEVARRVLVEAARYAALRLAEVEARDRYLRELHSR